MVTMIMVTNKSMERHPTKKKKKNCFPATKVVHRQDGDGIRLVDLSLGHVEHVVDSWGDELVGVQLHTRAHPRDQHRPELVVVEALAIRVFPDMVFTLDIYIV